LIRFNIQSVYCSYIFLYFCKAPITSYVFAHFLYFPVFFVIVRAAIESNKKSVNRKRKQLIASANKPHSKKQRVPVQDVADNVAAVSNTVNRKNGEAHMNKGPDKSSTKHKHATSSSKPKSTNSKNVTKEVTSKK